MTSVIYNSVNFELTLSYVIFHHGTYKRWLLRNSWTPYEEIQFVTNVENNAWAGLKKSTETLKEELLIFMI